MMKASSRLLLLSSLLAASGPGFFASPAAASAPPKAPYNVLLIAVDDLNDWVGVFGGAPQERSATPKMDKFASGGTVVFQQANCAGPICGPSRSSFLSGFMPNRSGVYTNSQNMLHSELVQTHLTLPEYFSKNGYHTLSIGKIFHKHSGDQGQWEDTKGGEGGRPDPALLNSRNRNIVDGKKNVVPAMPSEGNEGGEGEGSEFAWGPSKGSREATKDWGAAEWAAARLAEPPAKPFFLALGISKPHLPWYVPQEYFDRHPLESIKLPEFHTDDLGDVIDSKGGVKFTPSSDFKWVNQDPELFKSAVRGYLAATSFADDCVAHVLESLKKSPARDNTIVIIMGDHGWHLGEKLRFRKSTLWAESTRLPLLIKVPGMTSRQDCPRLVNLMDLYPTLIDLCGLPPKTGIDGRSIAPLLRDPKAAWPHPSVTVNGKGSASVCDERWYYIRYEDGTEEFYDMELDPMQLVNLVRSNDPEIGAPMARLAASFPASFVPEVAGSKGGSKGGKAQQSSKSGSNIRSERSAADLK